MSTSAQTEPQLIAEVSALRGLVTRLLRLAESGVETSQTIPQFCASEQISRAEYYVLKKQGRGPIEMRHANGCVRISPEARVEWRRSQEAASTTPPSGKP
jgi:hypothetical protein